VSNRPLAVQRHRRDAGWRQHARQVHNHCARLVRRGVNRLSPERRQDLQRHLDGLPPLCTDCRKRPWNLQINRPGNWLPTGVCRTCYYGDEYGHGSRGWEEAGWLPICGTCGGSGQYDGAVPCSTCDGLGVLDP
jgi:hypothetical protein